MRTQRHKTRERRRGKDQEREDKYEAGKMVRDKRTSKGELVTETTMHLTGLATKQTKRDNEKWCGHAGKHWQLNTLLSYDAEIPLMAFILEK